MSRHTIPSRSPGLSITVGWDTPLQTFFAQVSREDSDDDDPIVLWLGANYGEVNSPAQLAAALAPYAELSTDVIAQLRADRAACADRGPTPLQRQTIAVLRRRR